jgi:hypothetical protein
VLAQSLAARVRDFAFSASPADPIPGSSRDSTASGRRHSATPCHAMPGPVRSTVGAFPSGCPLIHARLRQACMQHRARCDAHYPYIHEIAWPPCVCFAAARRPRALCPRGGLWSEGGPGGECRRSRGMLMPPVLGVFLAASHHHQHPLFLAWPGTWASASDAPLACCTLH